MTKMCYRIGLTTRWCGRHGEWGNSCKSWSDSPAAAKFTSRRRHSKFQVTTRRAEWRNRGSGTTEPNYVRQVADWTKYTLGEKPIVRWSDISFRARAHSSAAAENHRLPHSSRQVAVCNNKLYCRTHARARRPYPSRSVARTHRGRCAHAIASP